MLPLESILVLGAGELGLSVLEGLHRYKEYHKLQNKIHCLLRPTTLAHPNSQQKQTLDRLTQQGVEAVSGDINDTEENLAQIFKSHDAVISCTGFAGQSGVQLKIARAALMANVTRFIPWQFGVDYDTIGANSAQHLFDEQLGVRDLLRKKAANANLQWIIISTGIFISFVFWEPFGIVQNWSTKDKETSVTGLGTYENRLSVTAVEDIGNLTAEIIFDAEIADRVVFVAGDTFTWTQLADKVERATGRSVTCRLLTVEECQKALEQEPENGLAMYRAVFSHGVGVAWDLQHTYNAQKGIPTLDIEGWVRRQLTDGH